MVSPKSSQSQKHFISWLMIFIFILKINLGIAKSNCSNIINKESNLKCVGRLSGVKIFRCSPPSPCSLAPFFVFRSCLAFFCSCRNFSRSSRVLSLVSRSLARLAFSRSSLALSRSSLALVFWFESMICVYDVWYMFMLISAFLNECQKSLRGSFYS